MKNLFIFGLMLFSICTAMAQEEERKQEFQIGLDIREGISNLHAYYKLAFEQNQNKYWRTRIGVVGEEYYRNRSDLYQKTRKTILGLGFEKRTPAKKNYQFIIGVEIYGIRETIEAFYPDSLQIFVPSSEKIGAGLSFPIGIILNKNSKWFVGIETIPGVQFQKTTKDEYKLSPNPHRKFGFYNYSFAICFGYRISTRRI